MNEDIALALEKIDSNIDVLKKLFSSNTTNIKNELYTIEDILNESDGNLLKEIEVLKDKVNAFQVKVNTNEVEINTLQNGVSGLDAEITNISKSLTDLRLDLLGTINNNVNYLKDRIQKLEDRVNNFNQQDTNPALPYTLPEDKYNLFLVDVITQKKYMVYVQNGELKASAA